MPTTIKDVLLAAGLKPEEVDAAIDRVNSAAVIKVLDKSFENQITYIPKKTRVRRPILIFGFTIFYSLTFLITLLLIFELLTLLQFNLIKLKNNSFSSSGFSR